MPAWAVSSRKGIDRPLVDSEDGSQFLRRGPLAEEGHPLQPLPVLPGQFIDPYLPGFARVGDDHHAFGRHSCLEPPVPDLEEVARRQPLDQVDRVERPPAGNLQHPLDEAFTRSCPADLEEQRMQGGLVEPPDEKGTTDDLRQEALDDGLHSGGEFVWPAGDDHEQSSRPPSVVMSRPGDDMANHLPRAEVGPVEIVQDQRRWLACGGRE